MRYLSVCSGIEAATVAWSGLGWKAVGFSEIEPFPCKVLKHHYPTVPNFGDMTFLPEKIRSGEIESPDLLCGGTPCQAFSVAGLRRSLDDDRGNLTLKFCEIADAIDETRSVPSIIFWENVPGVLNTKDNAFGCFLGALAGEDAPLVPPRGRWTNAGFIDGPKRAIAWRVLDAQYFGVAQRRRRVFVVASARDDFDPASVLFEFEGVRRDSPPSRKQGEEPSATTATSTEIGRNDHEVTVYEMHGQDSRVRDVGDVCTTVTGKYGTGGGNVPIAIGSHWDGDQYPHPTLSQSLKSSGGVGASNQELFSQRGAYLAPVTKSEFCVVHGTQTPIYSDITFPQGRNSGQENVVIQSTVVRRLTPRECERLQGFPDDYTAIPNAPDGSRYKALGNSWAVPVVKWIGERIARALA
jgi:DNA (cytosine-5)-methyltransferase 1